MLSYWLNKDKYAYPNRIVLRTPLWQRLFFPLVIPVAVYALIPPFLEDQMPALVTIGILIIFELYFIVLFFFSNPLIIDQEGISFNDFRKKRYYQWHEVSFISNCPVTSIYPFMVTIETHDNKGATFIESYGFMGTCVLGKILEAYHKAALEDRGITPPLY